MVFFAPLFCHMLYFLLIVFFSRAVFLFWMICVVILSCVIFHHCVSHLKTRMHFFHMKPLPLLFSQLHTVSYCIYSTYTILLHLCKCVHGASLCGSTVTFCHHGFSKSCLTPVVVKQAIKESCIQSGTRSSCRDAPIRLFQARYQF